MRAYVCVCVYYCTVINADADTSQNSYRCTVHCNLITCKEKPTNAPRNFISSPTNQSRSVSRKKLTLFRSL